MSEVTYYVALPFDPSDDGIAPGYRVLQPEFRGDEGGGLVTQARPRRAIAFSRSGDPATGDFGDANLIRKFGDVRDDLSAL